VVEACWWLEILWGSLGGENVGLAQLVESAGLQDTMGLLIAGAWALKKSNC
jgi:hypothetical protein